MVPLLDKAGAALPRQARIVRELLNFLWLGLLGHTNSMPDPVVLLRDLIEERTGLLIRDGQCARHVANTFVNVSQ
jgi:hypothetical protein